MNTHYFSFLLTLLHEYSLFTHLFISSYVLIIIIIINQYVPLTTNSLLPLVHILSLLYISISTYPSSHTPDTPSSGLSEVVGGMGIDKLQSLMPGIIETASRSDISPFVKDGYIMMFIYLPVTFKVDFHMFIAKIIPCILKVSGHK